MKRMVMIGFALVIAITLVGCSQSNPNIKPVLHVKPVDLFAGDAKKFEPFLGLMSGAVKLKYKGSKTSIKASIEIWENGTKKETLASMGGAILRASESGDHVYDGELILSVKKQNNTADENKTRYTVTSSYIDKSGSSSYEITLEADSKLTGSSPIVMNDKGMDIAENEDIAVWGMQTTDQNSMLTVDLTPEMLKRVRWAMIVKLSLADE
ncbi:hypothetical protein Back11_32810 [Paenibacillus baekrokdamisoli]|uniref:Uncharacterized protein n=1 Tax=Paenibacillus baekrokdamisoli TaxID=1712516 RepID=A0A3G9IU71_9BACL|nr:hypothetical protein [Paenibacillus baekrokdamisoli]MBB3071552.1 uncharacterized protein YrzB (UPF0473 family) [Paenibacillus baekrokdamisoli]BBH21936.1 hypothetical protein Back11_32810 [Paenibacillus baekrokdamisoli]